jgi:hypothetical protein
MQKNVKQLAQKTRAMYVFRIALPITIIKGILKKQKAT